MALVLAGIALLYVAAAGYLFAFQRHYVFQPFGELLAPAAVGLDGVEAMRWPMRDGVVLAGYYAAAAEGRPTLLYFHGNAGSLSDRAERFRQVRASGFGLLAASYRGYPGSGGAPSETALVSDALELFDWVAARSAAVVVHGESIGTGVGVAVAAERPVRALVLEAPFTAALDLAQERYPWLPARLLMRDPFLSCDRIARVSAPLLIVHGTADRIIPVAQARRLYAAAPGPKQLVIVEGGGHVDLWDRGLWATELKFLETQALADQADPEAVRRIPSLAGL